MFSVVRKILYHAHNYNPKGSSNNRGSSNEFLRQFRETLLYKSFVHYYNRLNPRDPELKEIYAFFKANEALGKHFARPNNTRAWGSAFDKTQYKEGALRINQEIIRKSEKQYSKKRADFSASTQGRTYALPNEFEWTDSAREFYNEHIFSQDSKAPKMPKPTYKQILKALKSKTLDKWNDILKQCSKLENAMTDNDIGAVAEIIKKDKSLQKIGAALQRDMSSKQQAQHKRVMRAITIALTKPRKPSKPPTPEPQPIKEPKPKPKPEPEPEPEPTPEPEESPKPPVDIDAFIEPVKPIKPPRVEKPEEKPKEPKEPEQNGTKEPAQPRKPSGLEVQLGDTSTSADLRDAISEVLPIPSPVPDPHESSEEEESTTEEEEETSSEEEEGSSDWDDSEDEFFAGSDDDMKADDFERRDSTASVIRQAKRFRNLNEFELKPEEKKWFRHCERSHNQLFMNGLHIQVQAAHDFFDEKLFDVWTTHAKKLKRKKSLYKKNQS